MEFSHGPFMNSLSSDSYETALCIIPPVSHCYHIDRLRGLYDKAYHTWPPHVNLIYPFVSPDNLARAQQRIQQRLDDELGPSHDTVVELNQAGLFKQRKTSTIFICERPNTSGSFLEALRQICVQAIGQKLTSAKLHLTIGQSESETISSREFLLAKARLLPNLSFRVDALAILIRERVSATDVSPPMRLWGILSLTSSDMCKVHLPEHWIRHIPLSAFQDIKSNGVSGNDIIGENIHHHKSNPPTGPTYCYDNDSDTWIIFTDVGFKIPDSSKISISSYNVLIETEYPPERDREPLLVRNVLSDAAMADILVLQEASDDFLSYLLSDTEVRQRYPFTSHGPPDQPDIGPLPSMRNIVILSSWPFSWISVPFDTRHKGALVAQFQGLSNSGPMSFVVAGVHLSCGLTDSSVAAKNDQLKQLTNYLSTNHDNDAWIVAGDFNIPTSSYTINFARHSGLITQQTALILASLEPAFKDIGLHDAYLTSCLEATDAKNVDDFDGLFEGEAGATFDPRNNVFAAVTSGTSENRPQRYDRVFIRSQNTLHVDCFNLFGLPENVNGIRVVASDHYGVRASIKITDRQDTSAGSDRDAIGKLRVKYKQATTGMSDFATLESTLRSQCMLPTEDQIAARKETFDLLKNVVLDTFDGQVSTSSSISLNLVAVGSYALGVWTSDSDLDCLCIGSISSKTFFKLARQRLAKAAERGIRVLRKVEAKTGTMLELSVNGIAADLQYCPAAQIADRWSEFHNLSAQDTIFNISMLSLRKLKPYRDLLYLQRTVPSLSVFRLAYRCIKLWAVQRGIYSSKFGYLSGTHITLMLAWICKKIWYDFGPVGAGDLVASFFDYYADFDWTHDLLFDAFFHKVSPRYHRNSREPMVILGYHTPNSNVAHTSTIPGLHILTRELRNAAEDLSRSGMTWDKFFMLPEYTAHGTRLDAAAIFRSSYRSYVKVDIQYWGRTLSKGKSLVGWIESRCLSLVIDINRTLPDLEVRIWPARFTDKKSNSGDFGDYHGCYLIGLSNTNEDLDAGKTGNQLAKQHLEKAFDRFLAQSRAEESNFDSTTSWLGVSLVRPTEVKSLRLDDCEWGDYTADLVPDSDAEEDIDEDEDTFDQKPIQRILPQRPKPTTAPLSTSKLRPASDVLNRLRWDPSLDPGDYMIGYEDRFLGVRETSLSNWKTEQTDEEFIPQHRILYFKRNSGNDGQGEIVWERVTRLDKLFGSGAGALNRHGDA